MIFSTLCTAANDESGGLSDSEIIDHLMFLLFAAHDTTSSTLSSMIRILWSIPPVAGAFAEEFSTLDAAALQTEHFGALPQTDWFFRETLRMHPPVPAIIRRTARACEWSGYTLPANTAVSFPSVSTTAWSSSGHRPGSLIRSAGRRVGRSTKGTVSSGCLWRWGASASGCTSPKCRRKYSCITCCGTTGLPGIKAQAADPLCAVGNTWQRLTGVTQPALSLPHRCLG